MQLLSILGMAALLCSAKPATSETSNTELPLGTPVTYSVGSKSTVFSNDIQCDVDSSVFFSAYETYSEGAGEFQLFSLRPSGDVVSFKTPPPIAGYSTYSFPSHFFVSNSQVLALVRAKKVDPSDPSRNIGFSRFVLVYDHQGMLLKSILLDTDLQPLNIAGFDSGSILIISQNKFSKKIGLTLIDQGGRTERELSLFESDYSSRIKKTDGTPIADPEKYMRLLLGAAHYVPFGKNLLIVPPKTAYPIIVLSERGVLSSINLALPAGQFIGALLPGNGRNWMVQPGAGKDGEAYDPEHGAFISAPQLDEFDSSDGHLVRVHHFAKDLIPVCQIDSQILFLTTRDQDGRIQIVKGNLQR